MTKKAKAVQFVSPWFRSQRFFREKVQPETFPILGLVFSVFLSFRSYFLDGALPGDTGDARGNVVMLDHWYRVLQGKEGVTQLLFFYPIENVLGNSDAFFLQGLFYSVNRFVGIQLVHAAIWATIFYAAIGLLGFHLLLKNLIESRTLRVLTIACIANSYPIISQTVHPQLLGLFSISWLGYFCLKLTRDPDSGGKWIYLIAVYFGVAALSTWYIIVSLFFYLLILIPILLVLIGKNVFLSKVKFYFSSIWKSLRLMSQLATICYLSLIAILGALFLRIYGHNIRNGVVSFPFSDVLNYAPRYGDLLNTSRGAFGPWFVFFEKLNLPVGGGERAMGYTPILFILFLGLLTGLFLRQSAYADKLIMLRAFLLTNLTILAIIMTDDQGHTPWFVFHNWVPLLGSARATFRFNIMLTFVLLVSLGYYFDFRSKTTKFPKKKKQYRVAFLLFFAIFVENIRVFPAAWTASDYLPEYASEILVDISSRDCSSFLLVPSVMPANPSFLAGDAAAIAVVSGVPTLNGATSVFPKNWDLFWISSQNYETQLNNWLGLNGISRSSVCTFIVSN